MMISLPLSLSLSLSLPSQTIVQSSTEDFETTKTTRKKRKSLTRETFIIHRDDHRSAPALRFPSSFFFAL